MYSWMAIFTGLLALVHVPADVDEIPILEKGGGGSSGNYLPA